MNTLTQELSFFLSFVMVIALLWFGFVFVVTKLLGGKVGGQVNKLGQKLFKGLLRLTWNIILKLWRWITN